MDSRWHELAAFVFYIAPILADLIRPSIGQKRPAMEIREIKDRLSILTVLENYSLKADITAMLSVPSGQDAEHAAIPKQIHTAASALTVVPTPEIRSSLLS